MRVISQNGKCDFPYESIILEFMADSNTVFAYTGTGQPFRVANYTSELKAQKAMEMLRKEYQQYKSGHSEYMWFAFDHPKVFQFPSDRDVEV